MGNGVDVLSDTQGVDFSAYIRRLLATLQRNWEAVMPESVRMGERGVVFTTFQINPDGSVVGAGPNPRKNVRKGTARQCRDVGDPRVEPVRAAAFSIPWTLSEITNRVHLQYSAGTS